MLEFKGVALIDMLLKLYVITLIDMLKRVAPPQYSKLAATLGFRKGPTYLADQRSLAQRFAEEQ